MVWGGFSMQVAKSSTYPVVADFHFCCTMWSSQSTNVKDGQLNRWTSCL